MKNKKIKMALLAAAILALPAAGHANTGYKSNQGASIEGSQSLSTEGVMEVQRALARQNFYTGSVDGIWGPRTTEAVRQYQQSNNMSVTGSLSASDLSSLGITASGDAGSLSNISPAAGDADTDVDADIDASGSLDSDNMNSGSSMDTGVSGDVNR